jgi:cytochrome d ubiquinol oxidase subunit II
MSGVGITGIIMTAGAAMFPFIMPSSTMPNSSLIAWDATSSHLTLTVMFWAAVIFIPIILLYTTWTYRRMWRRVTVAEIKAQDHAGLRGIPQSSPPSRRSSPSSRSAITA